METISKDKLLELLTSLKTSTFATIITETVPPMNKKNNPYFDDRLLKYMEANVCINFIYKNSVNRQRDKEGVEIEFKPKERRWGTRISGTPLVQHGDSYYLECRFLKHVNTFYLHKGNIIDEQLFVQWLKNGRSNAEHQGLSYENEVIVRDFKIDSILEIKMLGKHYIIK